MAVFIEFLAGSGLAIFFHWVLDYKEAAYTIFAVGILLSLVTWLLNLGSGFQDVNFVGK